MLNMQFTILAVNQEVVEKYQAVDHTFLFENLLHACKTGKKVAGETERHHFRS